MNGNKRFDPWTGVALWAAAAVLLAVQVLLPGFTGISNNGDFGKVFGWLSLAPRDVPFGYVQPTYDWAVRNYWDSPYHSSESALAWLATRMAGATHAGSTFDIRWLGAIHAALLLGAFAILLVRLRREMWPIQTAAVVPLVIFSDVFYTAYLNSFFMDAAALCTLLLMTASAIWMTAQAPRRTAPLCVFTVAALGFATSKTQHAIWLLLPVALLIAWGFQWTARWRVVAWGAAGLVLVAGLAELLTTDPAYRGEAMFNVLFYRLGPAGADLKTLGVRPEELRYSGMHAYTTGAPTTNYQWADAFGKRTGMARLLGWYTAHPRSTFGFLWKTLKVGAPEMRQTNLGNFRVGSGHAPGERTERFAAWSNFRAWLFRRWPWHIVVWYGAFLAGCLRNGSPLRWVAMGIAVLGLGEFGVAALGDSLDAGRHLFLFHAATDLTICFGAAWLLQKVVVPRTMRQTP